MKKANAFIPLCVITAWACIAAAVTDSNTVYGVAYGCAAVLFCYCMSLCGREDKITLATQNLDEAKIIISKRPGKWHLVAIYGSCVVAYRNENEALDAMVRDDLESKAGYAVVGA